ncbi:hypothetical protein EKO27_g9708 [Xylaria grammica]|uniref:Uncharacterized protein n=1 Tax=Xylaria grammica TaxID=363999 RepID=A0A439CTB1_9PEZI|nr:hypothetical protein EKO27_g9708 [Xylaria grammica]
MASKSISLVTIPLLYATYGAAVPLGLTASGTLTAAAPPATFTANPNVGPGGSTYTDSAHFRIYGATGSQATSSLQMLEGAYDCFIGTLGWRSSGLSYNTDNDDGPFYKVNVYSVAELPGAAGVMHSDYATGLAWLEVQQNYIAIPGVVVHEWGHGITYTERYWVDQGRTGAWWETVANWIADTYKTSSLCASARSAHGQSATATEINLQKVIGDSFQIALPGWVRPPVREMIRQYSKGSNETPLHSLDRIATANTAQQIVARYWARMAYADIGHATAKDVFLQQRSSINYANLDAQSTGTYKVKSARQPKYLGANIIPLKTSGSVTVTARVTASKAFIATLAVRNTSSGATREEASLVVVNTPAALIQYDPFSLSSDVQAGLDYTVTLTGATA